MSGLMNITPRLTSREIASIAGKLHKNVVQVIQKMEPAWVKVKYMYHLRDCENREQDSESQSAEISADFQITSESLKSTNVPDWFYQEHRFLITNYKDSKGRTYKEYSLDEDEVLYIASHYDDTIKAMLVQELKHKKATDPLGRSFKKDALSMIEDLRLTELDRLRQIALKEKAQAELTLAQKKLTEMETTTKELHTLIDMEIPDESVTSMMNRHVRAFVNQLALNKLNLTPEQAYTKAWSALYKKYYYHYNVDFKARRRNDVVKGVKCKSGSLLNYIYRHQREHIIPLAKLCVSMFKENK